MDRREFLQCAALLVSGASASQLGLALSGEQRVYLATASNYADQAVDYFTPAQRQTVAALAEAIIPATDTPGAIDAGVPRFIELMVAQWFNDGERTIFDAGLAELATQVQQDHGEPFEALPLKEQLSYLEQLEDDASDSKWYDLGNVTRAFVSDAPFICQLKELTIWGFFTSELGSTQVLRYVQMPMRFDGDLPLTPGESSWANTGL